MMIEKTCDVRMKREAGSENEGSLYDSRLTRTDEHNLFNRFQQKTRKRKFLWNRRIQSGSAGVDVPVTACVCHAKGNKQRAASKVQKPKGKRQKEGLTCAVRMLCGMLRAASLRYGNSSSCAHVGLFAGSA